MTISVLMLVLVIAMAYWWGAKGAFNAFIHMVLTVLSGALALGVFEPLGKLINTNWGPAVVLLSVFAFSLIGLRIAADRLVSGNLQINVFASWGIGSSCGAWSGVISGGIIMLGIFWMPQVQPAAYQPYVHSQNVVDVNTEPNHFFPVDKITVGFYNLLSNGSLTPLITRDTLQRQYPNMIKLASTKHLNANHAARKGSGSKTTLPRSAFELGQIYSIAAPDREIAGPSPFAPVQTQPAASEAQPNTETESDAPDPSPATTDESNADSSTPAEDTADSEQTAQVQTGTHTVVTTGEAYFKDVNITAANQKLYYVEVDFKVNTSSADPDGYLRISSAQIWMITKNSSTNAYQMRNCIAYIQNKTLNTFTEGFLWSNKPSELITLVFAVDKDDIPQQLVIKHARASIRGAKLNEVDNSAASLLALYNRNTVENNPLKDQTPINKEQDFIAANPRLPFKVSVSTFTTRGWAYDQRSRRAIIMRPIDLDAESQRTIEGYKVSQFQPAEKNHSILRVKFNMTRARSILGSVATRAQVTTTLPYLVDDEGTAHAPVGWAKLNSAGKEGQIFYDVQRNVPFTSLTQMDFKMVKENQMVYFYYSIPRETRLIRFQFQGAMIDEADAKLNIVVGQPINPQ